jgi:DNA-binding PadR family transcriptional regulator
MREKADILQGRLDLMALQTLSSMGPLHGYQIAARLEQVSDGALRLNMGALYPSLMRMDIGDAIEQLVLLIACSDASEWENRVLFLPY